MSSVETKILQGIPAKADTYQVLNFLELYDVKGSYLEIIKSFTKFNDIDISSLLNIDVKTYRKYRNEKTKSLKPSIQEYAVMILSLYKHGKHVFETVENFNLWMEEENFFFDNKSPSRFLETISGIKFIDDRLTAIEYGDNV
jgi:uncharacterized protein (DUF2384 family)